MILTAKISQRRPRGQDPWDPLTCTPYLQPPRRRSHQSPTTTESNNMGDKSGRSCRRANKIVVVLQPRDRSPFAC